MRGFNENVTRCAVESSGWNWFQPFHSSRHSIQIDQHTKRHEEWNRVNLSFTVYSICLIAVSIADQYWSVPSHYLNQCWIIINRTLRNKLQWNHYRNSYIFIQENAFECVVRKMAAIWSRPQCVDNQDGNGRWTNLTHHILYITRVGSWFTLSCILLWFELIDCDHIIYCLWGQQPWVSWVNELYESV